MNVVHTLSAFALLALLPGSHFAADLSQIQGAFRKEPIYQTKPKCFDAWKEACVSATRHEMPVLPHKPGPKPEPVSSRLRQELGHPHRASNLTGLRFAPDGKRIVAGDYPDGLVAVWELPAGKLLQTFETGPSYGSGLDYFVVSADFRKLYTWWQKRDMEQLQQGSKLLIRSTFDSGVRAWDLESGLQARTYKHHPPRGIQTMQLAPDGAKFVTYEELPGTFEDKPKMAVSLWDVQTGHYQSMPEGLSSWFMFSADSRTLFGTSADDQGQIQSVKILDPSTGSETKTLQLPHKTTWVTDLNLSPDGRWLVGSYCVFDDPHKQTTWRSLLKWWDTTTGKEVASLTGPPNGTFYYSRFSRDGKTFGILSRQISGRRQESKLLLFRVQDKQLVKPDWVWKSEPKEGKASSISRPVFSPDGKWLAVVSGMVPMPQWQQKLDAKDVPQPRIYLVDTATGEIRETLVSPSSLGREVSFSADGRWLATSGPGKIFLWDVADLTATTPKE